MHSALQIGPLLPSAPPAPTSEPQQEAIEAAGEGEGEDGEKLGFLAAAGLSQAEGQ